MAILVSCECGLTKTKGTKRCIRCMSLESMNRRLCRLEGELTQYRTKISADITRKERQIEAYRIKIAEYR